MNSTRIKAVRTTITEADRLQFLAHCLETGKTCADSFAKLSIPVQQMLVACATEFGRVRTVSTRPMPTPSNLRMMRLERRWSLDQAAVELARVHAGAGSWTAAGLCHIEEAPPARGTIKPGMIRDLEQVFQSGYEHLCARYVPPSE